LVIGADNSAWNIISYSLIRRVSQRLGNLGVGGERPEFPLFYDHGYYNVKIKAYEYNSPGTVGPATPLRPNGRSGWDDCG
jgi:hypothetical protein